MEEKSCFESELLWMLHFVCCFVLVYLRTMSFLKYINKIFNNSNSSCIMKLELSLRCFPCSVFCLCSFHVGAGVP